MDRCVLHKLPLLRYEQSKYLKRLIKTQLQIKNYKLQTSTTQDADRLAVLQHQRLQSDILCLAQHCEVLRGDPGLAETYGGDPAAGALQELKEILEGN